MIEEGRCELKKAERATRAPTVKWSDKELTVLREIATESGIDDTQLHRLPGRSRDSAHAKAVALGITLTTGERMVDLMADGKERSAAEIALQLGVPAATVRRCVSDMTVEGPDQELRVARVADDGRTLLLVAGAGPNAVRPLLKARRCRTTLGDDFTPPWWPKRDAAVALAMHAMLQVGR